MNSSGDLSQTTAPRVFGRTKTFLSAHASNIWGFFSNLSFLLTRRDIDKNADITKLIEVIRPMMTEAAADFYYKVTFKQNWSFKKKIGSHSFAYPDAERNPEFFMRSDILITLEDLTSSAADLQLTMLVTSGQRATHILFLSPRNDLLLLFTTQGSLATCVQTPEFRKGINFFISEVMNKCLYAAIPPSPPSRDLEAAILRSTCNHKPNI